MATIKRKPPRQAPQKQVRVNATKLARIRAFLDVSSDREAIETAFDRLLADEQMHRAHLRFLKAAGR